ncbi:amidohydrolase [Ferruginibacter sp. SUN106]|uniref:amidohydrolase n=1 Tax=Ferruginibacter sp. SUN106 TaxID=2978348 RepID=UPI003D36A06D
MPLKKLTISNLLLITFYTFLLYTLSSCKFRQKVPLIVHHAKIYTADEAFSTAEAMAVRDGKIIAIGTNDKILKEFEGEEEINAEGKTIFPGFIDAHCHFTGYATDLWKCNLTGTNSFDEVISKLVTYSKTAPMEWLYGRGWDQNDWDVKEFPSKEKLDSLFPDRPVFLKRVDGHAALANQKALNLANVTAASTIEGGSIELKNGRLSGILVDNAMGLVERVIPAISDSLAKKYYNEAQNTCFALGLTGVHDCGISEHTVELVDAEQKAGHLKMKIYAMLSDNAAYYDKWIAKGIYKTDLLTVGGFKLYGDGALGSRGACLLQDYTDKAGWKGFLLSDPKHFKEIAAKLANTKFQMCTHAIGDSGNRQILTIYAEVLKGKNDKRWRIEHAQVVNANDFDLFGKYNIIPSVQPTHATSDMYWADKRLGPERVKNAYAYKKLLNENGWMPLGTDFPVEDISPFKTFFAAVARQDSKDFPAGGFQMENALTREETLRGMTIWAAKAAFEEKEKGSLEEGKAADFIILDTDLISCDIKKVLNATVTKTYINGKLVYKK